MISNWQRSDFCVLWCTGPARILGRRQGLRSCRVLSMEFSVQLCQKGWTEEQNICIPVKFEWSLHPSGHEFALPVHYADSSMHTK